MASWAEYRACLQDKKFLVSVFVGVLMLISSMIINFYAGIYTVERASNSVTDVILSNTRTMDVDGIFIYGSFLFWIFVIILCFLRPNRIPFTLKSIALFIFIRSIFISLTHLGPFPDQIYINPESLINKFTSGADLFFSAHTGLPFLMALAFWNQKSLRFFFSVASVIFGAVVLLGHLHYSIDVLSAFFITYTIFHLSELAFKKDRAIFLNG
ncbi:hypothetical protein A3I27_00630 [Candidatus Giovannonibacteria bacterium RIFCSPLOWO2_02_FULL_43_11b]|uniref:Sphingomyelin synthase-like domain-containing protein n=1 Tax=Candidatus Giovannonibacteria bacterium RIFCSPHIGHO2_12_FULL_43_15 TaxID=1798341 RepID=A0A1F5WPM2_9BACT|nr:MAG: hypothetical protein A2739_00230 [Candidatus Giovannonibacteria bacterium RIFCSPHIGHO2_01_FULL_43_100]OGF66485.1 MAG: hypothetical protein A3B97_01325 [Candidatus Giovannonibacteria bacterium RIFCSPHIGHO2_02_FULL_43_32]OGF77608.1 MAG: hypothetical protein A3F23_00180 [Candidatus Giovannonibacteria bacterium RIFCSPHIGHO2_12_FULL_43_15]OGF79275.1 MAG: hypothetical protein A3A15_01395 [Candidatus Giovannonibacteria bacterium RIFCSPLOWO2_01_FULL_43_60]OGF90161.1 MAG: hypothetical protein A3